MTLVRWRCASAVALIHSPTTLWHYNAALLRLPDDDGYFRRAGSGSLVWSKTLSAPLDALGGHISGDDYYRAPLHAVAAPATHCRTAVGIGMQQ